MLQDVDWEVVRGVSPRFFWVYLHNRQHALPVLDRFLFPRVWYFLPISKSPRVASMGCFHQSRPWTAHSLANFTGHFFSLTFNGLVFAGNLQENPTLTGKIHGFRWRFSQENQSIETSPRSLGFELRKATEPSVSGGNHVNLSIAWWFQFELIAFSPPNRQISLEKDSLVI